MRIKSTVACYPAASLKRRKMLSLAEQSVFLSVQNYGHHSYLNGAVCELEIKYFSADGELIREFNGTIS